jgi:ribose/xylose/arabinose/galactoside ABC-type transport system permease subunit
MSGRGTSDRERSARDAGLPYGRITWERFVRSSCLSGIGGAHSLRSLLEEQV